MDLSCSAKAEHPVSAPVAGPSQRAPTSRTGVFIFRSTMSNSGAPSRQHRKSGNDDAERHCRDAIGIRVFFHTSRKLASNGREVLSLLPKEGGGAPNGAPIVAAPRCAGAAAAQ